MSEISHQRVAAGYPPSGIAWYAVVVLLLAYALSYVDRTIISLMVDPIKADFGISDTQFSLLQGLAFTITYTGFGLPMGWLVDRASRRLIIFAGIVGWSAATVGCSLARGFAGLAGWRILVGLGESALTPAADSAIADLFPPDRRAGPFALYNLGVAVGSGLALVIGGTVIQFVGAKSIPAVPLLGEMKPWQLTFILVGLPGFLVAVLALSLPEPARHGLYNSDGRRGSAGAWRFLWRRRGLYLPFLGGASIMAMTNAAFSAWVPTMMTRSFHWPRGMVGQTYGTITLIFGVLGAALTLMFGDTLLKCYNTKVMAVCYLAAGVFLVLAALSPFPYLTLACMTVPAFALGATPGLSAAMLQNTTPNQFRGRFIALFLIANALLASGAGPILPALLTDHIFGTENVKLSLACVAITFPPVAAVLMFFVSTRAPTALAEARTWADADAT